MIAKNPYQNYQHNAVSGARPEELTTMLYNRLLKDINFASAGIQNKDIQTAHNSIMHAQDIINHLMNTLDDSYDVSRGLNLLYEYMNRRLTEANIKKDTGILQEIGGMAEEIRDTWVRAVKLTRSDVAPDAK